MFHVDSDAIIFIKSSDGVSISRAGHPLFYDYFVGLGYAPNAQGLIKLPVLKESQVKGRFAEVDSYVSCR